MKGMVCPPAINPVFVLSFDEWDVQKFESLPDFIKDKIKTSDEYKAMYATPSKEEQFENNSKDTPFVETPKKDYKDAGDQRSEGVHNVVVKDDEIDKLPF